MVALIWDATGQRRYETGVNKGVLYQRDSAGNYVNGVAWNGLVSISESPSGAEATPMYADNIKYLNLISAEEFGATIEAFTYPDEFAANDGTKEIAPGITVGQQNRLTFGLSYRTLVGDDVLGTDKGYKIHLIYGALAAPTEKAFGTVNESPEAITFSWELTTTAVDVPGSKPSATITIDSTKVPAAKLAEIEAILYGSGATDPRLPLPAEIASIMSGTNTAVTAAAPSYNATTKVITIPTVTGVQYRIDGKAVSGTVTITKDTVVTAVATQGYKLSASSDDDWVYTFA